MVTEDNTTSSDTPNERAQTVNQNYGGDQNFNIGGGSLSTGPQTQYNAPQYNVAGDLVQSFTSAVSNPHRTLWDMVAGVKASHSSDLQFARGNCLWGTRKAVLQEIHRWRLSENHELPVCWLYGAAGVGKSAVALTIAKACERDGLAASFFFFRLDPRRNNPSALIVTIAHGLVVTRPCIGPLIDQRIAKDPRILEASLEEQYRELIVKTLVPEEREKGEEEEEKEERKKEKEKGKEKEKKKKWWTWLQERWSTVTLEKSTVTVEKDPDLIIIDGLDECGDADTQTRILSILFSSFEREPRTPLRFLICSRPESWIREAFDTSQYLRLTKRIVLDNSFTARKDIERYLLHSFKEIRESPKYAQVKFPNPWPAHHVIELLVHKSSGQFIYVVTVVRFIKSNFAHPFEQLQIILDSPYRMTPPAHNSPFHELDVLYNIVLFSNPDHHKLVDLLTAILLIPRHASPTFLEMLYELPSGAVSLALRAMHSVLNIRGPDDIILVYHTSFIDFLSDESRSGRFFVSPDKRSSLAHRWGRVLMNRWKDDLRHDERPKYKSLWTMWADFCLEIASPDVLCDMDEVYTIILSSCMHHEDHDWLPLLLAAIVLIPDHASPAFLECLFELTSGGVATTLKAMHPVLDGQGPNDIITLYSTPFNDFLADETRSGGFFVPGRRTLLGRRWGSVLIYRWENGLPRPKGMSLWTMWADFCMKIPSPEVLRDMDEVYTAILSGCWNLEDQDQLPSLLEAIIHIPHYASPTFLEMLFELPSGGVLLALRDMYPLLDIGGPDDIISVYHTSFNDFLVDENRSGIFFVSPDRRTSLGHRWGHVLMKRWKNGLRHDHRPEGKFPWTAWADFSLENSSEGASCKLDQFYTTILSDSSRHDEAISTLAVVILLRSVISVTPRYIETFLEYTPSQATRTLREVDWLLNEGEGKRLTIAHTSLNAFLLDKSRCRRFYIDRDYHRDYFVRRWLRVYHIFSEFKGTLFLRSWHKLCVELDSSEDTLFVELHKFYQDLWDLPLQRDKWSSVIATIVALSRYTEPSLELIDLLHETSTDPEMYYYLHLGKEWDLYSPHDNYPRFFHFLKDRCHSQEVSFPPGQQVLLARRMVKSLIQLCRDLQSHRWFEPRPPHWQFLWDTWGDICCAVDQPSEELLDALPELFCDNVVRASAKIVDLSGIPKRSCAPLRFHYHRSNLCLLLRHYEKVAEWLKSKACIIIVGGVLHTPRLVQSFENVQRRFHLKLGPSRHNRSAALNFAVQAVLDIVDCKYRASLLTLSATHQQYSDYADYITLTGCHCPKHSVFAVFSPVRIRYGKDQDWHVDIHAVCLTIALALTSDLKSAKDPAERSAVVLNVLDSSLLPRCGPKPDLLSFFRAVLEAAKDLSLDEVVSEYHKNKLLSWLQSFPKKYAKKTSDLSRNFLALLS